MDRIGVRELRQHASRYLARVASGESLVITDRGSPVAQLVPVPVEPLEELQHRGLLTAPSADLLDVQPAALPDGPALLSAVLEEQRAGER